MYKHHVHACTQGSQERAWMPWTGAADGYGYGPGPQCSARATRALDCHAVSLAPNANFVIHEDPTQGREWAPRRPTLHTATQRWTGHLPVPLGHQVGAEDSGKKENRVCSYMK